MSQVSIKVENISKHYVINHKSNRSDSLVGAVAGGIKNMFNKPYRLASREDFWALNDINFEINKGDRVGIIGRNGAGKSTLLKVLSRIVKPTTGRIEYEGRMASLLEVGTGFHGDLTGRENIYLNGSILGMTKQEITSKFDEIVAFSEIEKFLDTPVKRYSSGMYVRLAFAVAAHLESDILIVDEVLAVGDSAFQKKCLGKMNDISTNGGRTILFVSHQMNSLQALCNKGLVLNKGKISFNIGPADEAVKHYMLLANQTAKICIADRIDRVGEGKLKVTEITFLDKESMPMNELISGQELSVKVEYECINTYQGNSVTVALAIYGDDGILYTVLNSEHAGVDYKLVKGNGCFTCHINKLPLMEGTYFVNVSVNDSGITQDWVQEAVFINVIAGDFYGTGKISAATHKSVLIENSWR